MSTDIRELLARARKKFEDCGMAVDEPAPYEHKKLMNEIDAALAAESVGEAGELVDRLGWIAAQLGDIGWSDDSASVARAAALLQQFSAPAPPAPEPGEVGRLVEWLRSHSGQCVELSRPDWARMADRAADTLEAFRLGGWIVPTVEQVAPPAGPLDW